MSEFDSVMPNFKKGDQVKSNERHLDFIKGNSHKPIDGEIVSMSDGGVFKGVVCTVKVAEGYNTKIRAEWIEKKEDKVGLKIRWEKKYNSCDRYIGKYRNRTIFAITFKSDQFKGDEYNERDFKVSLIHDRRACGYTGEGLDG